MSDVIEPADNNDTEKLKRNRDAILNEKRELKVENERLKAELSSLQTRLATAESSVEDYKLNYPVNNLLDEIAIDPATLRHVLGERYKFVLHEGVPTLADLTGVPVEVDGKPLGLDGKAIEHFLCPAKPDAWQRRFLPLLVGSRASGSGASEAGKGGGGASSASAVPPPPKHSYGLR